MTSKLQRKIRAVSETAACTAVEGALDAVLFVRNKTKKNKEVSLSKGSMCCVFFVWRCADEDEDKRRRTNHAWTGRAGRRRRRRRERNGRWGEGFIVGDFLFCFFSVGLRIDDVVIFASDDEDDNDKFGSKRYTRTKSFDRYNKLENSYGCKAI